MSEFSTETYRPSAMEISREGDFYIKEISLTAFNGEKYDITHLRVNLMIFESIFTTAVTGEITLQDSLDLPHLMPLIGEEKIKFVFTRQDVPGKSKTREGRLLEDVSIEFRVYKMSGRENIKDRHQNYTLHFISDDFLNNFKIRVLKSYKAMPYSDMAAAILTEKLKTKKELNIETTKYLHSMAITNINPFAALNMLASRSESAEGNGCLYVCYEDRQKFNFVSIGKLFQQEVSESYSYGVRNVLEDTDSWYKDRTIEADLRSFEGYGFSGSFDVLKGLFMGLYGSRLLTYDLIRRIYEVKDFDYNAEFSAFKHLDKNKVFTDGLDVLSAPLAHVKFVATDKDHDIVPWIAEKEPGILPSRVEEHLLYRQSQLNQINQAKVVGTIPGDPRRKVGQIINFLLPHQQGNFSEEKAGEPYDNYLQGKYLITGLTHRIDVDKYMVDMEMIKDSLYTPIKHVNPVEEYTGNY